MFTDLEEFLADNLGYGTLELKALAALEKRAAHGAAFFAAFKKWRKEYPVQFRAWAANRYKRKKKDPAWWANRQATNRTYKERMKSDERYKALRRAQSLRNYYKRKATNPKWVEWKRADDRRRARIKRAKQKQLKLNFKEAA